MKKQLLLLSASSLILLSGCSAPSKIYETKATSNLYHVMNKSLNGKVQNTYDGKISEYSIYVKNIKIDFLKTNNFEDAIFTLDGDFSINDSTYSTKSKINAVFNTHIFIDQENGKLKLSEPQLANLQVNNIYNDYKNDIILSLKSSITSLVHNELDKNSFFDFTNFKNKINNEILSKNINDQYNFKIINNGKSVSLKISFVN